MKAQASFIAPLISAVCVAMAALIVQVLQKISEKLEEINKDFNIGGDESGGGMAETLNMVNMRNVMPPTMLLLIVGLYLVELVILLSYFSNGIENGFDQINRDMLIVKTMTTAMILFSGIVLAALMMFGSFIYSI